MKLKLCGKRYLITGASLGYGLEIVKRLMKVKGTKINVVARNIETLVKLQNLLPLSLDISMPDAVDLMVDKALLHMGGKDCIIACVGIGYYGRFSGKDYDHIEAIFRTNVLSPYTLQRILEKTNGKVAFVLVSSVLEKFGFPGMALYSATKHVLS